ncbi:MAG: hypothetical protein QQW96_07125 [Tychonema bourrellyi B0820]|nr:hypothetical protein [Tychonema bourrellyi]MDQ2097401.1 hypothetical protein [Tychonema bourrellyi B0820]
MWVEIVALNQVPEWDILRVKNEPRRREEREERKEKRVSRLLQDGL